jgi:uncharacterized protein DUF4266
MPSTFRLIARCAVALCLLCAASGCTHVKPYEREHLTRPGMDVEHEALAEEFEAHVHDAREAAPGARGSTGGGCGCN